MAGVACEPWADSATAACPGDAHRSEPPNDFGPG